MLPFALRGDSAALPTFSWIAPSDEELDPAKRLKAGIASLTSKSKTAPGAITVFKDSYREYQQEEERRLAYVAVTRARSHLLLTGAHWAGQKQPKAPSPYLIEAMEVLGRRPIEPVDPDENPYEGPGATLTWPLDPLGARRGIVESAAAAVRAAAEGDPVASPELVRLLAERAARLHGVDAPPPTRVPASRFKDYVTDFAGTVSSLVRPMPERPYRQTRLGTLFHAWVERRSELVGVGQRVDEALWEVDEDDLSFGESAGGAEVSSADAADLSTLQEIFEASEWGSLKPIAVEIEIDFALGGGALPGDEGHIVICKLDAVYRLSLIHI